MWMASGGNGSTYDKDDEFKVRGEDDDDDNRNNDAGVYSGYEIAIPNTNTSSFHSVGIRERRCVHVYEYRLYVYTQLSQYSEQNYVSLFTQFVSRTVKRAFCFEYFHCSGFDWETEL